MVGGTGMDTGFCPLLKIAVNHNFYAKKCLIRLDDLQNKNILQMAKNGKADPLYGKKW